MAEQNDLNIDKISIPEPESVYKRTNWVNGNIPSLNAENLNNIENGLQYLLDNGYLKKLAEYLTKEISTRVENDKLLNDKIDDTANTLADEIENTASALSTETENRITKDLALDNEIKSLKSTSSNHTQKLNTLDTSVVTINNDISELKSNLQTNSNNDLLTNINLNSLSSRVDSLVGKVDELEQNQENIGDNLVSYSDEIRLICGTSTEVLF